jgi:hypothetical protein
LTLVLNFSHFTGSLPVDFYIRSNLININLFTLGLNFEGEVEGTEFSISEVGELVDSHFVCFGRVGIMLSNPEEVFQEDSFSVFLFTHPCVGFFVVSLVLLE